MAEIIGEVVGRVCLEAIGAVITQAVGQLISEKRRKKKAISSAIKLNQQLPADRSRAVLISSSNMNFGNDCERLVNIAFQTSQSFPTIIRTYSDCQQYLRTELAKQYPNETFCVIIGKNQHLGIAVEDGQYFAEIQHARYSILIFTTKQNSQSKFDTHDANSQVPFKWD
ncbi:unnamed protein product [Adineta ricciae]|uniref:Uncharacterized protein n=1 Tax=Adineta ricciae TaxID=249248 RepID=A0A814WPH4_ADIRI|nr:unnamed protein product [Adineta ricciae]CAF1208418.1 unnamed protein product [Adineta ricciae]